METCDLSQLSKAERERWIGWKPTAPELMPDADEKTLIAAELHVARELRTRAAKPKPQREYLRVTVGRLGKRSGFSNTNINRKR